MPIEMFARGFRRLGLVEFAVLSVSSENHMNYAIELFDGHVLVALPEGRFLIDTGSPLSFARTGRVSFGGMETDLAPSLPGLDADGLSRLVGKPLDGLLGMDILGRHVVTFGLSELSVDEAEPDLAFAELETGRIEGIPVVAALANGRTARMFVDSGAKISYLAPERLAGLPVEETLHDFYPGAGEFDVEVSTAGCELGGHSFRARFGRPPVLVRTVLSMYGVDGILGRDLFAAVAVRLARGSVAIAPFGDGA